jgi:oligopeptide transport system permease protein
MSDPSTTSLVPSPVEQPGGGLSAPSAAAAAAQDKPRGLYSDAWHDLRRKPMFWVSAVLIAFFLIMAAFPWLFSHTNPTDGNLAFSRDEPSAHAWFGKDVLGRDVYARVIYGARASIVVGLAATISTTLFGAAMGIIAGFRGGWADSVTSRLGEIFAGVPFVLGGLVFLFTFNPPGSEPNEWKTIFIVVLALCVLSWPVSMRLMRSSVISVRNADYVIAARALGASTSRIIIKHILPNCLAPLLAYSTILIGAFIGAEAALSYLGVGLRSPVVSWGVMISESQYFLRVSPFLLFFPAVFLVVAVLAFVMMGEAIREALDPKLR